MVRGEAQPPQLGYWQAAVLTGQRTVAEMFSRLPVETAGIISGYAMGAAEYAAGGEFGWQENRLYRFGQQIDEALKVAFPEDPARQYEIAQTLAQGLGSTAAFGGGAVAAQILGAGTKGQLALIALSGAAAGAPDEFARVTRAMAEGTADEQDRILVTLANIGLGLTEAVPFGGTLGAATRGVRGRAIAGLRQAGEEVLQEEVQTLGVVSQFEFSGP